MRLPDVNSKIPKFLDIFSNSWSVYGMDALIIVEGDIVLRYC